MLTFNRLACFVLILFPTVAVGLQDEKQESEFTPQQLEFFETKVRPIFVNRCYKCHSGEKTEGGLNLESRQSILKGGDYGPAIEAGDPDESLIIDAVNYGDFYEMPPKSKLPQTEIDILTKWVVDGAAWPETDEAAEVVGEIFDLAQRKSDHWCWHPVERPEIPNAAGDWASDPIDNFIQQQVNAAGLQVAEKADKATLLRRVCFDLIGLPPTKEQIQAFVVDQTDTFEQVVDELLASPHFGERWARHWMDLTRFAETCGHEFDYPIPHAFQYRDYLIRAFNSDVPYDQFVREQIAGDLMTEPRLNSEQKYNESILGTGFWFLGEATHGPVDVKGDEAGRVDNQIDVMTKSFLGLTVACARCHDHKFDALSTKDYYALAGFLQSSRRQKAMLDMDAKIEESLQQINPLNAQSQTLLTDLGNAIGNGDPVRLGRYFEAAIKVARTDPKWFADRGINIQGESLRTIHSDSGIVETQEIKPEGKLNWQGNKQAWWRDGKETGHSWELEFELAKAGTYMVNLAGTVAKDYGAAKIFLNDSLVVDRAEFFGSELTTKSIELGQHQLQAGKQKLRFELLPAHEQAIKRNMIGVDYLTCLPVDENAGGVTPLTPDQVAQEFGLDASVLLRLLESLNSPAVESVSHPVHILRKLMNGKIELNAASFAKMASDLNAHNQTAAKTRDEAIKFADFESDDHGWFQTGFGFPNNTNDYTFLNELDVVPPGVMNSGAYGRSFFGVIRSPTFVITHNNIHVRLRCKDARMRLVIDGFVMDEYNGLLFADALVKKATHDQFQWRTQSGDIKKYIGHRAHFEVIDHNDGYAAIDEIWFSNGPAPKDYSSHLSIVAVSEAADISTVCKNLAERVVLVAGDAKSKQTKDRADILSWVLSSETHAAFLDPSESNVALGGNDSTRITRQLTSEIKRTRSQINKIATKTPKPRFAVAMTDGSGENEFVFVRGNHKTLGKPAERQFLEALVGDDANRYANNHGSGRMDLVDQIVDPKNPLTSRVMVNRIWHHLTGRGIVASVDNFGILGTRPTNKELLDYLADEFVKDDWSVKRMIRRVALSSTYQMSSKPNPAAVDVDPDNELMHRARIRRLQGEVIRDSVLSASGELDRKLYGHSIPIHLTPFMQGRGRPGASGPLDGQRRRSIYTEVRRNFLSPMMLAFDTPIPFNATGRRNLSNVPAQALILMNDPFVIEQAEKWATRLMTGEKTVEAKIQSIYLSAFGRLPTETELETAKAFIQLQAKELGADNSSPEVWQDFCHVIFNVKEFIYIK